ncbi:expressed unknown protein [Seminavis robusta]|uniref:Uncharacterized protein n=1 Tax=Seminavis robusta TaxID=568900 RepID=A0A9N8H3V8_9STRA|nr:expressed unknown protein [Seminavis robusta]|eukprot:Sro1_g000570.1 n/a (438) ;mRNA; f:162903-164216
MEEQWETDAKEANQEALRQIRRHVPVNVRGLSEAALSRNPSPNGMNLPKTMAKKFKRTNVLMLLRVNPSAIERMHPSSLENIRVTGLTLTERRALHAHLQPLGIAWSRNKTLDATIERRWSWYSRLRSNFQESLAVYNRHLTQYGPPNDHPYATRENPSAGCPLIGKQCPVRADKAMDYSGDYGWTEEAEYEEYGGGHDVVGNRNDPKAKAMQQPDLNDPNAKAMQQLELSKERRANERAGILKKHYKGVLYVAKANGSCEQMDEAVDRMERALTSWIKSSITKTEFTNDDTDMQVACFTNALNGLKLVVLHLAARSGMKTHGKRSAGDDGPDRRSALECGLAEEVFEYAATIFAYIKDRMDVLQVKDSRVSKTMEFLEDLLDQLHGRNVTSLGRLGVDRPERSRKPKTVLEIQEDIKNGLIQQEGSSSLDDSWVVV